MQRLRRPLTAVACLAILVATLSPDAADARMQMQSLCIVCGERGLADAVANVVLFLPFGLLLATWVPQRLVVILGVVLSASVELAQIGIPGRDPSLGDVFWNGAGGVLGVLLVASWRSWARPSRRVAGGLTLAWGVGVAFAFWLTGWSLAPAPPRAVYWGQWTADLGMDVYRGRVLSAIIGPVPLPPHRLAASARVRSLLLADAPISAQVVTGPPPVGLAPLLSVYDEHQNQVFLLGAEGGDLVFQQATRGTSVRLSPLTARATGALAHPAGDTLDITVRGGARGSYCLSVDSRTACTRGQSYGDGWKLFAPNWEYTPTENLLLGALWLFLLLTPLIYWALASAATLAVPVLLVLGALAALMDGRWLAAPGVAELVGLGIALIAALLLRRLATARLPGVGDMLWPGPLPLHPRDAGGEPIRRTEWPQRGLRPDRSGGMGSFASGGGTREKGAARSQQVTRSPGAEPLPEGAEHDPRARETPEI